MIACTITPLSSVITAVPNLITKTGFCIPQKYQFILISAFLVLLYSAGPWPPLISARPSPHSSRRLCLRRPRYYKPAAGRLQFPSYTRPYNSGRLLSVGPGRVVRHPPSARRPFCSPRGSPSDDWESLPAIWIGVARPGRRPHGLPPP